MELQEIHDYKITKGFDKILSLENKEGYLQIIQKLTRTKLIVKDNKVLIIW
jgi:rRNA processing protein Krr1/Pno1